MTEYTVISFLFKGAFILRYCLMSTLLSCTLIFPQREDHQSSKYVIVVLHISAIGCDELGTSSQQQHTCFPPNMTKWLMKSLIWFQSCLFDLILALPNRAEQRICLLEPNQQILHSGDSFPQEHTHNPRQIVLFPPCICKKFTPSSLLLQVQS